MNTLKNDSIYIISTSLNLGGSEIQAVRLANYLSKTGKNVEFISLKQGGILKENLEKNINLKEYNLYSKSKNKIFPKLRSFIWFLRAAVRSRVNFGDRKATVVSFLFHASFFGFLLTFKKSNLRHIVSVRSDRFTARKSKSLILREIIMRIVTNDSYHVVFNSAVSYRKYLKKFKLINKSSVILNISESGMIKIEEKKFNKKSIRGLYVGRLDELKNIDSLIKSFQFIDNKNITLDIYGQGALKNSLDDLIKNNNLSDKIYLKCLYKNIIYQSKDYDFLILTSFHEGYPNVIIEAMKNYLFVISTNVGDVSNLIDEKTGILINGFDPLSIAEAINKFESLSQDYIFKILENAKKKVEHKTNLDTISKSWLEIV